MIILENAKMYSVYIRAAQKQNYTAWFWKTTYFSWSMFLKIQILNETVKFTFLRLGDRAVEAY